MQITYVTAFNNKNIHNWSGLGYYYGKMLSESGFADVHSIDVTARSFPLKPLHWAEAKFNSIIGKSRPALFSLTKAKLFANLIDRKKTCNHIISPNTVALACLDRSYKKILYTDSTLANLLSCYPNYDHLDQETLTQADELERSAISNADLLIYTSAWAATSAVRDYGAHADKVFIVPFGANMQNLPDADQVEASIDARSISKHLHLLFVGVEWERKGGDRAVRLAKTLNELGYPTTLHVVGIRNLRRFVEEDFILDYGYISKQSASGERQLRQLMSRCSFLILPSLADCTPVVFSEAGAFGLPCLASEVGGNSGVIRSNINGKTFPIQEFVAGSVEYIVDLLEKPDDYKALCLSSLNTYETELNWHSTGEKIYALVNAI